MTTSSAATEAATAKHVQDHQAYNAGTNVVFLAPDVAEVFTDSASVNRALRLLLDLAKEQASTKRSA